MTRYLIVVEHGPNNLSAYAPDVDGCIATGATVEEVLHTMQEALTMHLEALAEQGEPLPTPAHIAAEFVDVVVKVPPLEIEDAKAADLTDTAGASQLLTAQFGRSFGIDSVQQLVRQKKLRAFLFYQGRLTEHFPEGTARGKELIFLRSDLAALQTPPRPGRRARPALEEADIVE